MSTQPRREPAGRERGDPSQLGHLSDGNEGPWPGGCTSQGLSSSSVIAAPSSPGARTSEGTVLLKSLTLGKCRVHVC